MVSAPTMNDLVDKSDKCNHLYDTQLELSQSPKIHKKTISATTACSAYSCACKVGILAHMFDGRAASHILTRY